MRPTPRPPRTLRGAEAAGVAPGEIAEVDDRFDSPAHKLALDGSVEQAEPAAQEGKHAVPSKLRVGKRVGDWSVLEEEPRRRLLVVCDGGLTRRRAAVIFVVGFALGAATARFAAKPA